MLQCFHIQAGGSAKSEMVDKVKIATEILKKENIENVDRWNATRYSYNSRNW